MKRQIRANVFETNSSSTHSITMVMKEDYQKFESGECFLCKYSYGWSRYTFQPEENKMYAKEEVINLLSQKYDKERLENDEDYFSEKAREEEFYCYDDLGEYLEWYCEEFTTPSGETIVAFGEYGYDG